jgi:hypothetical protein
MAKKAATPPKNKAARVREAAKSQPSETPVVSQAPVPPVATTTDTPPPAAPPVESDAPNVPPVPRPAANPAISAPPPPAVAAETAKNAAGSPLGRQITLEEILAGRPAFVRGQATEPEAEATETAATDAE